MIWLNPRTVSIGAVLLDEVRMVSVDEKSEKLLLEFGDGGPHPTFADVPERRHVIKVRRRVLGNETLALGVGEEGSFAMRTAPAGSDVEGVQVTALVVVTGISYRIERHDGAEQVIEAVAVSLDGASDPVEVALDGGS